MSKFTITLSAEQVGTLFEMCEFCTSAIHHHAKVVGHDDDSPPPAAFGAVMGIQDKLDGCEDLESEAPSLLEQAGQDGKPFVITSFKSIEAGWRGK